LNVLPLKVPALHDRRADIPHLVLFFLGRFSKRCGKQIEGVSQETMELLMRYPWPGNIRELQNVMERGVALCQERILHLGSDLLPVERSHQVSASINPIGEGEPEFVSLVEVEKRHIQSVLKATGGVIEGPKGAARILDLHPNTLRSRMKKFGVGRLDHELS